MHHCSKFYENLSTITMVLLKIFLLATTRAPEHARPVHSTETDIKYNGSSNRHIKITRNSLKLAKEICCQYYIIQYTMWPKKLITQEQAYNSLKSNYKHELNREEQQCIAVMDPEMYISFLFARCLPMRRDPCWHCCMSHRCCCCSCVGLFTD